MYHFFIEKLIHKSSITVTDVFGPRGTPPGGGGPWAGARLAGGVCAGDEAPGTGFSGDPEGGRRQTVGPMKRERGF